MRHVVLVLYADGIGSGSPVLTTRSPIPRSDHHLPAKISAAPALPLLPRPPH
jgi:hypothetical protein